MSPVKKIGLFAGYGVEMEYMVVHRDTLQVLPITDQVLQAQAGKTTSDVERGDMAWSNELVLHVLELKTNGPAKTLAGLHHKFHKEVLRINELLEPMNAMLLPTGVHPFMDPFTETKLWPHDSSQIYEAYNRIFNCQGHGWANLQSTHLNLPFSNDEEFGRLHAAIRLVLPLVPALSAASPLLDGKVSGLLDTRLEVYRKNQQKVPQIAGEVVPEAVFTEADYHAQIFEPMFKAIAPHDPAGILQEEFLNSRGAIARFGRGTIEIRIIDNQECPLADMAIVTLVTEVLKMLVSEAWSTYHNQKEIDTSMLASVFVQSLKNGRKTEVTDAAYLNALGLPASCATIEEIWQALWARVKENDAFDEQTTHAILTLIKQGSLAERMLLVVGTTPDLEKVKTLYRDLANCLSTNQLFIP